MMHWVKRLAWRIVDKEYREEIECMLVERRAELVEVRRSVETQVRNELAAQVRQAHQECADKLKLHEQALAGKLITKRERGMLFYQLHHRAGPAAYGPFNDAVDRAVVRIEPSLNRGSRAEVATLHLTIPAVHCGVVLGEMGPADSAALPAAQS